MLLYYFGLFTIMAGFAQQEHTISLKSGIFFNLYKDEVSYPLTHWVPSVGINIGYEHETAASIHYGELSFLFGQPKNASSGTISLRKWIDPETDELEVLEYIKTKESITLLLNYSYHHKVLEAGGYSLYPGIELDYGFNLLLADFPTITSNISLAPSIQQKYRFSENNDIRLTVSMPLVNYILRPPFVGVDDVILNMAEENPLQIYETGNFATLDKYFSLFIKLDYRHKILPWLEGTIGIQSRYSYIADPRPKRDFTFDILPGLNFNF